MSVKSLARAIAQGGHTGSYNAQCRRTRRTERYRGRQYVKDAAFDADGEHVEPREQIMDYDRDSTGRSAPLKRWLASQVGQPYELVRHKLARLDRTDRRGRPLLADHVDDFTLSASATHASRVADYIADEDGIVRTRDAFDWPRRHVVSMSIEELQSTLAA